jgi:hypothetical protein
MESVPLLARERLCQLFEGRHLLVEPQPDRTCVATGRLDLGVVLTMRLDAASSGREAAVASLPGLARSAPG